MADEPKSHSTDLIETAAHERLLSDSRFKLRLMLLVALIVLVLTALLFSLVSRVFATLTPSIEQDLKWKVSSGLLELRQSADLGVLTGNRELVAQAAGRYDADSDFRYIAFRDAKGHVIFERGQRPGAPRGEPMALVSEDDHYSSWSPIEVEGLNVGRVELVVSKQRLQSGSELYRRILWAGLGGAVIALVLAWLFVNRYIGPILQLTHRAFAELERKTEAALASTRAKSRFLANMSHEIRTPMNGVLGMVHLLQQTRLDTQQRRYVEVITGSAKSLLTIVNDILDFSKLEADKYELLPEKCSPKALIEQTADLFRPRAREKGLELSVLVGNSVPPAVLLDGVRFRQVLSNLLSNAIKFTDDGEVRIIVETRQAPTDDGLALAIRVEDTGVGVTEEARTKLFQAFSQVDESSTRAHEGTGLGLAISRRLVELMGGEIQHAPRPGGGSVFFFRLPAVPCSERPEAVRSSGWVKTFVSANPVLVVDDNEINQMVVLEMLEDLSLEVDVVGSGAEAVEAVAERDYALVLMDCQMPGMDGYQATKAIRDAEPAERRVPIIACTAHAFDEERRRVADCGMDGFLAKPLGPGELRTELAKWLRVGEVGERDRGSTQEPPPAAPPAPTAAPEEPIELDVLDSSRGPSQKVLQLFIEKVPSDIERLRQAATLGNASEVKALAHKLKGSAGSIGAKRLAEVCHRLQIHASAIAGPDLAGWVDLIERLHRVVRQRLQPERLVESSAP